ncbi:unnamed protein product [Ostreobium quekettii]|uniref:Coilin tudor domain-containing protein n=1 Tax=Ostreobium quekettii TaxID=121088 RepID=A0A8S1JAT1_9CHLO|nr:unnamed protein product [Ostreobium quekettii]
MGGAKKRQKPAAGLRGAPARGPVHRLRLVFEKCIVTAMLRERKLHRALYLLRPEIRTIADLARQVCHDFTLGCSVEQLHFSVEGFTVPFKSPVRILMPNELVDVGLLEVKRASSPVGYIQRTKKVSNPTALHSAQQVPKLQSKCQEEVQLTGRKRKHQAPTVAGGDVAPPNKKLAGREGRSLAAPQKECSERAAVAKGTTAPKKLQQAHVRFDSSHTSSSSDQQSSDDTSDDTTSADSSSEASSTGSSDSSSEVGNSSTTTEETTSSSESDESSSGSTDSNAAGEEKCSDDGKVHHKEAHTNHHLNEMDDWQRTTDTLPVLDREPAIGDVVAYRILEVGQDWQPRVSAFRRGKVTSYDAEQGWTVLSPWPDVSIHPDPNVQEQHDKLQACGSSDADNEDDGPGLLPPQSEYADDGTLTRKRLDFVEIRLVEASKALASGQYAAHSGNGPPVQRSSQDPGMESSGGQPNGAVSHCIAQHTPQTRGEGGRKRRRRGPNHSKQSSLSPGQVASTENGCGKNASPAVLTESTLAQLAEELHARKSELMKTARQSGANGQANGSQNPGDGEGRSKQVMPRPHGWRSSAVGPLWAYLQSTRPQD